MISFSKSKGHFEKGDTISFNLSKWLELANVDFSLTMLLEQFVNIGNIGTGIFSLLLKKKKIRIKKRVLG